MGTRWRVGDAELDEAGRVKVWQGVSQDPEKRPLHISGPYPAVVCGSASAPPTGHPNATGPVSHIAERASPEETARCAADLKKLGLDEPRLVFMNNGFPCFLWARELSDEERKAVEWYLRQRIAER